MTCDDWIEQLDAWLEGQLGQPALSAFEAHRSTCAACARVAADARRVEQWAHALPAEIAPPTDHWPAIEARIGKAPEVAPRGVRRVPWTWALAAAVLLAVGSSAITAKLVVPGTEPTVVADSEAQPWELEIRAATADLSAAMEARRDQMDPETIRIVEQNLAIIDRAILETREALARTPGDDRAEDALVAAYNHKIRLLQQALRAPAQQG